MVYFFLEKNENIIAVQTVGELLTDDISKLEWLFGEAAFINTTEITGRFIGARREMVTPWSSNAVDITANMNIQGVVRIEQFTPVEKGTHKYNGQPGCSTLTSADNAMQSYDPMLQMLYENLTVDVFTVDRQREPVRYIDDVAAYDRQEGLALNDDEISYLKRLQEKLGRKLTDSEIFGFSQVNSEHCRHKIFNGQFVIDGEAKPLSLFQLIKRTSIANPNRIVSAYKDNCAFIEGTQIERFVPEYGDKPGFFGPRAEDVDISLKAETHNFPTTVEPFNGAATGSGGEIRDRVAGGKGAVPLAGTAVYMTSYPRPSETEIEATELQISPNTENDPCLITPGEGNIECNFQLSTFNSQLKMSPRTWLYRSPLDILIKASNGASDFGNKFGQPLICGSVLTFEHFEKGKKYGFDKVIMMAGGVGFGRKSDCMKGIPEPGDNIVVLGGDNYRIGMGGGAVSSVATGEYDNAIELNAVQRSNPEMQKRVVNAIRAMTESKHNPIVSIHDHGAGGHLNCLSELVEATGGKIDMRRLPIGDPTLSDKEILCNESQERMGLVLKEKDVETLRRCALRERAPMYVVGEVTGDRRLTFENPDTGEKPIELMLDDMFGATPKTVIKDITIPADFEPITYNENKLHEYLESILQLEAVACKDWLTNKVDRSVTGLVATQQTAGEIQLPLNNLGVVALDFSGVSGIATSIGHAPGVALSDAAAGSRLSIAEALTNIVWAPLVGGLKGVSLSANWQWSCNNPGEDARLYTAVEAASQFAIDLGLNIPTGKDSLSMTQKYPNGDVVLSPGTVIISAVAQTGDVRKTVRPVLVNDPSSCIIYVGLSRIPFGLGGSSFAQLSGKMGGAVPDIDDTAYFANAFEVLQDLIGKGMILAGHDVSSGGLITALLEMCFANCEGGMEVDLSGIGTHGMQICVDNVSDTHGLQICADNKLQIHTSNLSDTHGLQICADDKLQIHTSNLSDMHGLQIRASGGADNVAGENFESDIIQLLFAENPAFILQVRKADCTKVFEAFEQVGIQTYNIGKPVSGRMMYVGFNGEKYKFDINRLRDLWFKTSYLLDGRQSGKKQATERFNNYKRQPLVYTFPAHFEGTMAQYGIDPHRTTPTGIRAAIIREQGSQCDRETAWMLHLAGMDVKDVHTTDLIDGRETLDDVNMIAFVGGFSYSDVFGSAKGWAGSLRYNEKAKAAIDRFYARLDTLSIGICNGCQLMIELGLITPDDEQKPRMEHNDSKKFESAFVNVNVPENNSVMLQSLAGARLGVWVAHGEGKFNLPMPIAHYNIPLRYSYDAYPGNPNGSPHGVAAICSVDGRHLAIMPHPERSIYPWNWAHYPVSRRHDQITPWVEAFVNAAKWISGSS